MRLHESNDKHVYIFLFFFIYKTTTKDTRQRKRKKRMIILFNGYNRKDIDSFDTTQVHCKKTYSIFSVPENIRWVELMIRL
jgi:hypothetical protein